MSKAEISLEIAELHDRLMNAKTHSNRILMIREFKENIVSGESGKYITLPISGKLILAVKRGDGKITCWYCGRPLDNSLSRVRGCGPICIERYGPIPGREAVERQITVIYKGYVNECRKAGTKYLGVHKWLATLPDEEFAARWKKIVEEFDPRTREAQ